MITKLMQQLIDETTPDDIPERYRPVVDIVGVERFARLSDYAKGDEIYFPKVESITAPARNRHIRKEYNGYNKKELAGKYGLTVQQIDYILKDVPTPGQMDIFDWEKASGQTF